jgi:hypothetical protein
MKTLASKPLPPLSLLKELLIVDFTSPSGLRWRASRSNRIKIGDVAGCQNKLGYWVIRIKTDEKRLYLCHRIIYFMETGQDPVGFFIDHTTRDPSNNTAIRLATHSQNHANKDKQKTYKGGKTSSKYKGVKWYKQYSKWTAVIWVKNEQKFLGYFVNEKEAAKAYNEAATKYFGEFARLNEIVE